MQDRKLMGKVILGMATALLFSGCTTANIHKDRSYDKRLTEVSVAVQPVSLGSKGSDPALMARFNQEAFFVLKNAPKALSEKLETYGVKVAPMAETAGPALIIRPKSGQRTCQRGNCSDEIWYYVFLYEKAQKKTVWSAEFKLYGTGHSQLSREQQESSMKWFANNITNALKDSRLLPKKAITSKSQN